MQRNAFEINGSSVPHALLGLGSAHHHEEVIPMVYSMSSSGSRSGYEALVTQQTAKREIVSPKSDPKMDRLAVVARQATMMARNLILLLNHTVESGGRDLINDIVLLICLATYANPTKLRLQLSEEGTVVTSHSHFLSSRYSSEDLQEMGLFTSRVVGQYINLIDGSRVHISNGIADESSPGSAQ